MVKAVKIEETIFDFLEEHPEIRASIDEGSLVFSPTVKGSIEDLSFTTGIGNEIEISYTYNGEPQRFPPIK